MRLKGILAGLMGVAFVVAAILIYEGSCEANEVILGGVVMGVASGLAAAIFKEKVSALYVFVDVAILGIYLYFVVRYARSFSSAVGIVVGVIYGVSLYSGWLKRPAGEASEEP